MALLKSTIVEGDLKVTNDLDASSIQINSSEATDGLLPFSNGSNTIGKSDLAWKEAYINTIHGTTDKALDSGTLGGKNGAHYLNAGNATGTLPISHGGTGGTTALAAVVNLMNEVNSWSSVNVGPTERILATTSGGNAGTYTFSDLWEKYYKGKVEGLGYTTVDTKYYAGAGLTLNPSNNAFNVKYGTSAGTAAEGNHTHLYAGSSSVGGNATKADSIATVTGDSDIDRPVFFGYSGDNTKVVYNDNFKYNPSTDLLSVGKVQLDALYFPTNGGYIPKIGCDVHTIQLMTGSKQIKVSNTLGKSVNTYTYPDKDGTIALQSDIPTNYVTTNTAQTISGQKTFSETIKIDNNGIIINSHDKNLNVWEVTGNSGSWESVYGFHERYNGTGGGNDNTLTLMADNQSGTHVAVRTVKQDGDLTFHTPTTFDSTVQINGNLTVGGTTTTVNAENLAVKDKVIEIASGNTVALTSMAGLVVPKADGTNACGLLFDKDGAAYIGDLTNYSSNKDIALSSNTNLKPIALADGSNASGAWANTLNTPGSLYWTQGEYGANLNNSDLVGVNGIYFGGDKDVADSSEEGLNFAYTTGKYDTLYCNNGAVYIRPNHQKGTSKGATSKKLAFESQLNNYAALAGNNNFTGEITLTGVLGQVSSKGAQHFLGIDLLTNKGKITWCASEEATVGQAFKVYQTGTAGSEFNDWNPILWSGTHTSSESAVPSTGYGSVYKSSVLKVQPSTGTIKANVFKGKTVQFDNSAKIEYNISKECIEFIFI